MSKWQDNELLNFFNPPSGAVLQRPWYCESQGACKRFKEGYVTTAGKTHKQLWEKFRKNGLVFYDLSESRTITNTDRNFVVFSSEQVLHFDLEVKY